MSNDKFANSSDSLISSARNCFAITPSDSLPLSSVTKALYVGSAGDIVLRSIDGEDDVTFTNVPAGLVLDVRAQFVRSTGTSAAAIVGLA